MPTEQVLSIIIAFSALTAAVIFAVKIPKDNWFKTPVVNSEDLDYWAPIYRWNEKLKLIGLHSCWLLPLILLSRYIASINMELKFLCGQTLGISHATWYVTGLLFIFSLIFLAIVDCKVLYWRKVFQHGQFPLPNQKVWKPQKIIKGTKAKRRAKWLIMLLSLLGSSFFLCMVALFFLLTNMDIQTSLAAKCG